MDRPEFGQLSKWHCSDAVDKESETGTEIAHATKWWVENGSKLSQKFMTSILCYTYRDVAPKTGLNGKFSPLPWTSSDNYQYDSWPLPLSVCTISASHTNTGRFHYSQNVWWKQFFKSNHYSALGLRGVTWISAECWVFSPQFEELINGLSHNGVNSRFWRWVLILNGATFWG
jgi:hypothetical protein